MVLVWSRSSLIVASVGGLDGGPCVVQSNSSLFSGLGGCPCMLQSNSS